MKKVYNIASKVFSGKINYQAQTLMLSVGEADKPFTIEVETLDTATRDKLQIRIYNYQQMMRAADGLDMEFEVSSTTNPHSVCLSGSAQPILQTLVGIMLLDQAFVNQLSAEISSLRSTSPVQPSGMRRDFFASAASSGPGVRLTPETAAAQCLEILSRLSQEQRPAALGIITAEIPQLKT